MLQTARTRAVLYPLILLIFALVVSGCDEFSLYDQFMTVEDARLTITPAVAALFVSETVNFTASGGSGGYVFTVLEGNGGEILGTSETVVYTAPADPGEFTVRVTDADGEFVDASVQVYVRSELRIYPDVLFISIDGEYDFAATGGTPPYSFSYYRKNAGGSITAGGDYTAPSVPTPIGTPDIIRVTDANLRTADAAVNVVQDGDLTIYPGAPSIEQGESIQFTAYGGDTAFGYTFSVIGSPPGVFFPATATYEAPSDQVGADLAQIRVTDGTDTDDAYVSVVPRKPGSLDVSKGTLGPQDLSVRWVDETGGAADGYVVERVRVEDGATGTFPLTLGDVIITGGVNVEWIDTGLSPNDFYRYRVKATAGSLESPWTDPFYIQNKP
jgi:hypothetical protein